MNKLTQKYVIVHLLSDLLTGYEYPMSEWPLHITLADIFAISGKPSELISDLERHLTSCKPITTKVFGKDWFGEDNNIPVILLEKTNELQQLHDRVIEVLNQHAAKFNNPQYINDGFRPHSTVQKNGQLKIDDIVTVNSITLIDMFPNRDPRQRRILGTVHF